MTTRNKIELVWPGKDSDKALVPTENGKYGYSWVEPTDPRYCQTQPLVEGEYIEGVQAPKSEDVAYSERADLEPTTDNLLINGESGDVLEALTRVPELADKYVGQVKLCYIDPPFNTEKTFTHYEDNLEHSIWLTMMRDRLVHIKKLLADDGSIWVHLDDSENHRMRVLMDEVFGAGNFVAEVVWQKASSPRNDSKRFSGDHDVILVYSKTATTVFNREVIRDERRALYTNPDNDPNGPWMLDNPAAPGSQERGYIGGVQHPFTGEMMYPSKGRHWSYGPERLLGAMKGWGKYEASTPSVKSLNNRAAAAGISVDEINSETPDLLAIGWDSDFRDKCVSLWKSGNVLPQILFTKNGYGGAMVKRYLPRVGEPPRTLWLHTDVGHNRSAKNESNLLFPGTNPFATPKPERLLERSIHIATNPGDIVLDVFAGSGTTAAVAHKMGRRWVTCELLESNFSTFTLPRLTKVVRGEDPGGITSTAGERVDATEDGLPEGLSPEEAQKLTSLLNKAIKGDESLKKDAAVRKIKAMVKTRNSGDVINWRGGGGFHVAHIGLTAVQDVRGVGLRPR